MKINNILVFLLLLCAGMSAFAKKMSSKQLEKTLVKWLVPNFQKMEHVARLWLPKLE